MLSKLYALHYGSNYNEWNGSLKYHDGLFVNPTDSSKPGVLKIRDSKGIDVSTCFIVGFGQDIEPISWIHNKTEYISGIYGDAQDPSNLSTVNFDDLLFVKNPGDQGKLEYAESINSSGSYTDTEIYTTANWYIRRKDEKNLGKMKLKDGSYVYPLFKDSAKNQYLMNVQTLATGMGPAAKGFKSKSLLTAGDVHVGCSALGSYRSIPLSESVDAHYYAFKYV